MLFRGHADSTWKLDSTFARWARERYDCSTNESFFQLSRTFLQHFGQAYGPSAELLDVAANHPGIDAWFELMKRIQQHNEDGEFDGVNQMGTNLMDWSTDIDVSLCFASQALAIEGALYLFDAQAAGAILIQKPYREILDLWVAAVDAADVRGNPILFCPRRQIADARATRQGARYVAQIDLRLPVNEPWNKRETEEPTAGRVWHRMLLSPAVKEALAIELAKKDVAYETLMQ